MIRVKVIKASRLLTVAAIVLLVIVLAVLLLRGALNNDRPASAPLQGQSVVADGDQNQQAVAAFAATASDSGARVAEVVFEDEHTDRPAPGMQIEVLRPKAAQRVVPAAGQRILIYHTHTHEAYSQVPEDPYEETEQWRTTDPEHSVVRVGEELASLLREMGFEVTHDTTDHEPPKLGTAYVRSLATLEGYAEAGEDFDCYIDLHRDAYSQAAYQTLSVTAAGGAEAAQLMMLIGNGDGFDEKPDYEQNLAFAQQVSGDLNAISPGICKGVMVKTGRYNQHVGKRAVLVEVGHNLNTLQQALNSMPYLAQAIGDALTGQAEDGRKTVPVSGSAP